MLASYAAIPPGAPVRLAKRTSNLFRFRDAGARDRARRPAGLDVGALNRVLGVDPDARTAEVQGMTTYEDLVAATLPHGLMPLVVPQLKTITLGGAVTGLGIESSSFRNGLPHESVREIDVLTGAGEVVTARPDNEHRELFRGFPNSYGTLGYAVRLTIDLEPVKPYVHLRHLRFTGADEAMAAFERICADRRYDGEPVDFIDGTVFAPGELYITLAAFTDEAPWTSDYTGRRIYYRSIANNGAAAADDYLTVHDYLWRWDTDWFWCSKALGVQNPLVRSVVPRRYLRSDVYRKAVALDRRYGLSARVARLRGQAPPEPVIQDIEVTADRGAEFLDFFHREIGMAPIWMCPLRLREPEPWPLYPLEYDRLYVNFGFWGGVPSRPDRPEGHHNRLVEAEVSRLGGHKSLYSEAFYDAEEFWRLYNGDAYWRLKRAYDPDERLLDLYAKCVQDR
ncbi:FAD-binding oxidoreductase [Allonocardiopsis opalescens]|uniref:FAD-binding oxidoreductase n=1 Tax=Allonocardiopsis opalescens TaxID=1144618 RepID=UPI001B805DC7|nr:FAD-binding oxidoreductase [Allonocardiopsis opalescens]